MIYHAHQSFAQIINPALPNEIGGRPQFTEGTTPLAYLIALIWTTLITLAGITTLLFLIWGGLEWLTAGGDKNRVESAQHRITNAIFGLAFVAGSLAISIFVQSVFGINLVNPRFFGLGP